ncbi:MAG: 3-hydroxyacyl-ACP dehydratase FabZ, partial [Mycoplasmatales bacterium]
VDRIIDGIPGKSAVGIKCVSANEMHFLGHFPEHHVMPGVLIIEALAQVGAVALLSTDEFRGKIAFFGGIKEAKFRKQVTPGDTLKMEVELTKVRGRIGIGEAKAFVDDELACSATLTFFIGE